MNYRLIFCLLLLVAMVGVVSADTLIVYSGYSGYIYASGSRVPFSTLRDATTGTVYTDEIDAGLLAGTITANSYNRLYRGYMEFNTSLLGSGATISSAYYSTPGDVLWLDLGSFDVALTAFNPATVGVDAVSGDYDGFSDTVFTDYLSSTGLSTSGAYNNNFTFNTDGKNSINKTGWSTYYIRTKWDITTNTTGLTWSGGKYSAFRTYIPSHKPLLQITYTTGGGSAPVAAFTCTKNFLRIPNSVTCTDSSTNTPTSWSWDMGDGSAAKTTQNVTYPYMKRGIWGITLNATNAQGSNVTPSASNVRVVGYENNG